MAGLVALAGACGYDTPGTEEVTTTFEVLSGEITSARYDADTDTVVIVGAPYDDGLLAGTYLRDPGLDVNGFRAYRNPGGFSSYIAYWRTSDSGATSAGVVRNADYFDFGYGGSIYRRDASTTIPREGLASYTAGYVGLIAFNGQAGLNVTRGDISIEVDFADERMRGFVVNRENVSTGTPLPNLVLNDATFSNGHSTGGTAISREPDGTPIEQGTYAALFGGPDAAEVVGVFVIESSVPGPGNVTARETGVFSGTRD